MNSYYLHRKTGGIYRVLAQEYHRGEARQAGDVVMPYYGVTETWESPYFVTDAYPDGALVVFYENAVTGQRWARAFSMFGDGRFVEFEKPPLEAIAALKSEKQP